MSLVVFVMAGALEPEVAPRHVAINPQCVSAVLQMGNTDTAEIWTNDSEQTTVIGTFDEVVKKLNAEMT